MWMPPGPLQPYPMSPAAAAAAARRLSPRRNRGKDFVLPDVPMLDSPVWSDDDEKTGPFQTRGGGACASPQLPLPQQRPPTMMYPTSAPPLPPLIQIPRFSSPRPFSHLVTSPNYPQGGGLRDKVPLCSSAPQMLATTAPAGGGGERPKPILVTPTQMAPPVPLMSSCGVGAGGGDVRRGDGNGNDRSGFARTVMTNDGEGGGRNRKRAWNVEPGGRRRVTPPDAVAGTAFGDGGEEEEELSPDLPSQIAVARRRRKQRVASIKDNELADDSGGGGGDALYRADRALSKPSAFDLSRGDEGGGRSRRPSSPSSSHFAISEFGGSTASLLGQRAYNQDGDIDACEMSVMGVNIEDSYVDDHHVTEADAVSCFGEAFGTSSVADDKTSFFCGNGADFPSAMKCPRPRLHRVHIQSTHTQRRSGDGNSINIREAFDDGGVPNVKRSTVLAGGSPFSADVGDANKEAVLCTSSNMSDGSACTSDAYERAMQERFRSSVRARRSLCSVKMSHVTLKSAIAASPPMMHSFFSGTTAAEGSGSVAPGVKEVNNNDNNSDNRFCSSRYSIVPSLDGTPLKSVSVGLHPNNALSRKGGRLSSGSSVTALPEMESIHDDVSNNNGDDNYGYDYEYYADVLGITPVSKKVMDSIHSSVLTSAADATIKRRLSLQQVGESSPSWPSPYDFNGLESDYYFLNEGSFLYCGTAESLASQSKREGSSGSGNRSNYSSGGDESIKRNNTVLSSARGEGADEAFWWDYCVLQDDANPGDSGGGHRVDSRRKPQLSITVPTNTNANANAARSRCFSAMSPTNPAGYDASTTDWPPSSPSSPRHSAAPVNRNRSAVKSVSTKFSSPSPSSSSPNNKAAVAMRGKKESTVTSNKLSVNINTYRCANGAGAAVATPSSSGVSGASVLRKHARETCVAKLPSRKNNLNGSLAPPSASSSSPLAPRRSIESHNEVSLPSLNIPNFSMNRRTSDECDASGIYGLTSDWLAGSLSLRDRSNHRSRDCARLQPPSSPLLGKKRVVSRGSAAVAAADTQKCLPVSQGNVGSPLEEMQNTS